MSSVFDGDWVGKYLDWQSGVFGEVMSESVWDDDAGKSTDSTCLVKIDYEFEINKAWANIVAIIHKCI